MAWVEKYSFEFVIKDSKREIIATFVSKSLDGCLSWINLIEQEKETLRKLKALEKRRRGKDYDKKSKIREENTLVKLRSRVSLLTKEPAIVRKKGIENVFDRTATAQDNAGISVFGTWTPQGIPSGGVLTWNVEPSFVETAKSMRTLCQSF